MKCLFYHVPWGWGLSSSVEARDVAAGGPMDTPALRSDGTKHPELDYSRHDLENAFE
jgi:hypothetical protein